MGLYKYYDPVTGTRKPIKAGAIVNMDGTNEYTPDDVKGIDNKIGDLTALQTTDKSSLVNAINENSTQMAESVQSFNEHLSDYIRQPGYGVTSGSANAYTLTLNPALTAYAAGVCVAVKIHVANTGASTININGKGAKSIRDSKGNVLTAGKLITNGVYTLRYDGTNFILQGEGGSGNATASDLLSGKTASTDAGDIVGTMQNRATVAYSITTQGGQYIVPEGYHNGLGKVTASFANLVAENVKSGVNIGGVVGNLSLPTVVASADLAKMEFVVSTPVSGGGASWKTVRKIQLPSTVSGTIQAAGNFTGVSGAVSYVRVLQDGNIGVDEVSVTSAVARNFGGTFDVSAGALIEIQLKCNRGDTTVVLNNCTVSYYNSKPPTPTLIQ